MDLGKEFISAIQQMVRDRNLSEDVVISSLEAALGSAYRKYRESEADPEVFINRETGAVDFFEVKHVVEEVKEAGDITLLQAKEQGWTDVEIGDVLRVPVYVHPEKFGRIAAQTARQVIIQRLKDAEREVVFNQFSEKIGDLVIGEIFKAENDQIFVKMSERSEALLLKEERMPGEAYEPGTTMRFYLLDVRQTNRGPRIVVSRTHPGLLRRLMELAVPEIADGSVEIMGIVREAGARAKIAVRATKPEIDPQGACIGAAGARIKSVSNELRGEKIDIVIYSDDPLEYIKNALSPAKPIKVELVDGTERAAKVYVPADQLSLAIGKTGQNVRLAARLVGWRVDILPVGEEKN